MQNLAAIARLRAPSGDVPFADFGNTSRLFDGINDYITLGDSEDYTYGDSLNDSAFSMSIWIYPIDADVFRIISKWDVFTGDGNEYVFATNASNKLILYLQDKANAANRGRIANGIDLSTYHNTWVHCVCTYDGRGGTGAVDGIKLYIDGVRSDDTDVSTGTYVAMNNTATNLEIGRINGNSYADGKMCDARLYNSVLSQADIDDLGAGTNVTTNLVGHWIKDADFIANVVINYGSGGNNGTNVCTTFDAGGPGD